MHGLLVYIHLKPFRPRLAKKIADKAKSSHDDWKISI
jgi:hypothetical protein